MRYIKAKTREGETELFNVDNILNITPYTGGCAKILMGAGLYWTIRTDTIELIECSNDLIKAIKGGNENE